jgi:hypothetical protein
MHACITVGFACSFCAPADIAKAPTSVNPVDRNMRNAQIIHCSVVLLIIHSHAPPLQGKAWGADLPKSPVMLNPQLKGAQPINVFIVPVGKWSDGSAAPVM